MLCAGAASVLLANPHTQGLEPALSRGFPNTAPGRAAMRMGEGLAGRAALERRLVDVPDLLAADIDLQAERTPGGGHFRAYPATPLIPKGKVNGILEAFHRQPFTADADWIGFLQTLAGQAAIAVDNLTLFDDLQRSNAELMLAYDATLEGWVRALDLRDKETEGHTQRVTDMTAELAASMDISGLELADVRRGTLLHDIGKLATPARILLKPGALTDEEREIMCRHPGYAHEWLSPIPFLRRAMEIPYGHHEKWDGTGYPRGLKGEQIPLSARIFALVDAWDALLSDRPYRAGWAELKVREHIRSLAGMHFDPSIAEIFLRHVQRRLAAA